ncbi:MAG: hypothetical protein LBR16_03500 [Treponema sp.]|jgi:hypothetical protein|nr:hypothetical protein [Treponema sp.]
MLARDDFVFTIGYDGPAAVVDRQAKRAYRSLSAAQLAEKGLFRAGYAAALYAKSAEAQDQVAAAYNAALNPAAPNSAPLDRLFGVFPVEASKAISL